MIRLGLKNMRKTMKLKLSNLDVEYQAGRFKIGDKMYLARKINKLWCLYRDYVRVDLSNVMMTVKPVFKGSKSDLLDYIKDMILVDKL